MPTKRRVYWVGEDGESHELALGDADPLPKVGDVVNPPGELPHRVVEIDETSEPDTFELVVEPIRQDPKAKG